MGGGEGDEGVTGGRCPQPGGVVRGGGGDGLPVRAEGHAGDAVDVAGQGGDLPAGGHAPQRDRVAGAGSRYAGAVGAESKGPEAATGVGERRDGSAVGHQVHLAFVAPTEVKMSWTCCQAAMYWAAELPG